MSGPSPAVDVRIRPLGPDDGDRLAEFFDGLSEASRATFGPHPLDPPTATAIAAAAGTDGTVRIVGVEPSGGVVAYGILVLGVGAPEAGRCASAGVALDPATDAMVAPAVAEAWHGRGLGAALLAALLAAACAEHRHRVALLGGVQVQNTAAVRLYERAGFHEVTRWEHPPGTWNADMVLDLSSRARRTTGPPVG